MANIFPCKIQRKKNNDVSEWFSGYLGHIPVKANWRKSDQDVIDISLDARSIAWKAGQPVPGKRKAYIWAITPCFWGLPIDIVILFTAVLPAIAIEDGVFLGRAKLLQFVKLSFLPCLIFRLNPNFALETINISR